LTFWGDKIVGAPSVDIGSRVTVLEWSEVFPAVAYQKDGRIPGRIRRRRRKMCGFILIRRRE